MQNALPWVNEAESLLYIPLRLIVDIVTQRRCGRHVRSLANAIGATLFR
ncbi:MAG: hypothetical protein WAM90_05890 [Rhodanobacter sp.]